MATPDMTLPPMMTFLQGRAPIRAVVVGAGGTGGRLIPPLIQVLRPGDSLCIVDGDIVEDRNLARQNFRLRDVGENKAEVLATRYRREGIETSAFATMLTPSNAGSICGSADGQYVVLLGCVDNAAARQLMHETMSRVSSVWIDGGNEMRGGQVILSANHWPMKVNSARAGVAHTQEGRYALPGLKVAMPQLLLPAPWTCATCEVQNKGGQVCSKCKQPEASCADRIDLQTVAVNVLSATCMLNMLTAVLHAVPIMNCGAFFSTLNTMSPIKLAAVNWDHYLLTPETTYADSAMRLPD